MARVALLSVCVLLAVASHALALQCIGDHGQPVDWWIAFKYPKPDGRMYSYTDSANSTNTLYRSSQQFANGYSSGLNSTLSQLYGQPVGSVSYILFNDDPPESRKRSAEATPQKAHAKGVVGVDNQGQGFWLMHSVPEFPVSPYESRSFQYMEDGQTKYGQSLLCVSFNGWPTFDMIGYQLQVYRPQFYQSQMTLALQSNAPNLYAAVDSGKYFNENMTSTKDLKTRAGMPIRSLAKTGVWGADWDMYSNLVAPSLQQALLVETWRQGSGNPLPSNCTGQYHVLNVEYLDINGEAWKYTADHSKWAIAQASGSGWVCVAGINRMGSQGKRGGGALCFVNDSLHASLLSSITQLGPC